MQVVTDENVAWARAHFATMEGGAAWGVPRAGLLFARQGNALHLRLRMPHVEAMLPAITPELLDQQQREEFANIKALFEAAGIPVVWDVLNDNPEPKVESVVKVDVPIAE